MKVHANLVFMVVLVMADVPSAWCSCWYLAFSRVRREDHIRTLPLRGDLEHLKMLTHNDDLEAW